MPPSGRWKLLAVCLKLATGTETQKNQIILHRRLGQQCGCAHHWNRETEQTHLNDVFKTFTTWRCQQFG
uniref:Putative secreted protein n=1 Tax=Anopheles marajoara TaxID=58244 RepID=A0A2M4CEY1_9DIPT